MKDAFLSYIPRSFISIFQRGFEPLSPSHLLILLMFLSCWLTSSVNVCICWYRACICRNGILFVLLRKHVIWFSPPCIDCVFRKFTAHFLFKRKFFSFGGLNPPLAFVEGQYCDFLINHLSFVFNLMYKFVTSQFFYKVEVFQFSNIRCYGRHV